MALTIRLTPEDDKLIEKLKDMLSLGSASKALLEAARLVIDELIPIKGKLRQANEDLLELQRDYKQLQDLMKEHYRLQEQIAIICFDGHPGSLPGTEENCNHNQLPVAAAGMNNDCKFFSYEIVDLSELSPKDKVLLIDINGEPGIFTVDEINAELECFTVEEHNFDVSELHDIILLHE